MIVEQLAPGDGLSKASPGSFRQLYALKFSDGGTFVMPTECPRCCTGHPRNDRGAVVLSNLSTFMPRLHTVSGGQLGAFLFATYALVLGVGEVITL
jgi:hypothetical protein